jgi:transcriptional regulator GlxA family with amidase domain
MRLQTRASLARDVSDGRKEGQVRGSAEITYDRLVYANVRTTPVRHRAFQRLRIEDARQRLERTEAPIDDISWRVGYEDPAFFRRLFKRTTGLASGAYRKRFRIPEFARP